MLTNWGWGRGGLGAKSYDRKKAWSSINHSILFAPTAAGYIGKNTPASICRRQEALFCIRNTLRDWVQVSVCIQTAIELLPGGHGMGKSFCYIWNEIEEQQGGGGGLMGG